ncbi:MAG: TetR/AcrR family transcriptional regulator [Desertifilum sp. SIO1I2]|nr:TetR/AcrR family transcriptional regulator [Desertifilum sp. SIO1I2]
MPKIVDRAQYRQELLSKCFNLFAQQGYGSVTMRQIAQEIGVSTGTLYHYFPSKENLFEQLVEYISCQDTDEQNLAEIRQMPTLQARIETMFAFITRQEEYLMHQTLMLVDFCRYQGREAINRHQYFSPVAERYERAIVDCLGFQDEVLARAIATFIEGVIIRRLYLGDRIDIAEQAQILGQMVVAYLEK